MNIIAASLLALSFYFVEGDKAFFNTGQRDFQGTGISASSESRVIQPPPVIIELTDVDIATFSIIDDRIAYDSKGFYLNGIRDNKVSPQPDILKADKRSMQTIGAHTRNFDDRFYRDRNYVYYHDMIFNADVASFRLLEHDVFADKHFIYYKGKIVQGSDGSKECKFITDTHFGEVIDFGELDFGNVRIEKDKCIFFINNNNVYCNGKLIENADPETFAVLNTSGFATDKKNVYFKTEILKGGDATTFTYIDGNYYKDKRHVYFNLEKIKNADPATFEVIVVSTSFYNSTNNRTTAQLDRSYAKDKKRVYRSGVTLPASFSILNNTYAIDGQYIYLYGGDIAGYTKVLTDADVATFELVGGRYAKDHTRVYYQAYVIQEADPATFRYIGSDYAADKNNVYRFGSVDKRIDAASLEVLSDHYFKDKNKVYYQGKAIDESRIDPASFLVIDDRYAADNHNVYMHGEKAFSRWRNEELRVVGEFITVGNRVYHNGRSFMPDFASFKKLNSYFAVDSAKVYYLKRDTPFYSNRYYYSIVSADMESFEILSDIYSRDKNYIYYENRIIPADVKTFRLLDHPGLAYDKNILFYNGDAYSVSIDIATFCYLPRLTGKYNYLVLAGDANILFLVGDNFIRFISGADPATFRHYDDNYCVDKNSVYYNFTKIDADVVLFRKGRTINYKQYYIDNKYVYLDGVVQEDLNVADYHMDWWI